MERILLLCAVFVAACLPAFSQNFTILYQTPDQLFVCDADTLTVTVTNNTFEPISGALLEVEMPSGLEYQPGSAMGAGESSISNLNKPVLSLPVLQPGAPVVVKMILGAGCGLVEAINNGDLFPLVLRVRNGAQAEQITTASFIVETGLLVITQVDNDSVSGQKGDMLVRTLHVQNTRLGAIRHLRLQDVHPAGISIQTSGASGQNDQPTLFQAQFDGAFFTGFGDGDDLLEFNETVLIEEKITITDCAIPTGFEVNSSITAAWACTVAAASCQGDSVAAEVTILPYDKLPKLVFTSEYGYPFDRCAEYPAAQTIHIENQGNAPANNVLVQLVSTKPDKFAMEGGSFRYKIGGSETPVTPNLAVPTTLPLCNVQHDSLVILVIPTVPAGGTMDILFNTFFCTEACDPTLYPLLGSFFHVVECPEGGSVADTFLLGPQLDLATWQGGITFSIGDCVENGQQDTFLYYIQSGRLLQDEGYAWLQLDLPWGVFLDPACEPIADGESPVLITLDTLVTYDTITRVRIAYDLPLPNDSIFVPFCLRTYCLSDGTYSYLPPVPPPGPTGNFSILNVVCSACGFKGEGQFVLTKKLDDNLTCGLSSCSDFKLQTECACPLDTVPTTNGGGGGAGEGCGACYYNGSLRHSFEAYRLNLGLPDHDDNRAADVGVVDTLKIRRDRFLPGDTMHVIMGTRVLTGDSLCGLEYNIFTEVIRSDIPYANVNDAFDVATARGFFANPKRFRNLGAMIRIWDSSTGEYYECSVDSLDVIYKNLYGIVTNVNVQPTVKIDELVTMRQRLNLNVNYLQELGCVPPCFVFSAGDSIQVVTDFKLDFNYTPYCEQHSPPLINFEMAFQPESIDYPDFYAYRRFDTLMFQYSGYRDTVTNNTFGIRPCQNSQEIKPFSYAIAIARENLFPFEVRQLNRVIDYDFLVLDQLNLNAATLKYLHLQEGVNQPAYQNLPLPFTQDSTHIDIDFSGVFDVPHDEGYKLETNLVFDPSCTFRSPDTSWQYLTLDFEGCLSMPDTVVKLVLNKIGFFSNQARDTITADELIYDFPSSDVSADVLLSNLAPVAGPNYWIELVNPEGGLSDFELLQLPQNTPIANSNGVFQLGTLGILAQKNLRIKAQNSSCDPQRLWVIYGWDCAPHLVPGSVSCASDTLELLFRPQLAELELDLLQFPADAPLCDTSDYIVFEVFNADLGFAYAPFANVQLPGGMQILPGSSQVAYPSGGAFLPVPDPAVLPNNTFEWNLASLVPTVAQNGLPGVNTDPQNGIQIRFKVVASCGVVSSSQLVFGASAEQLCGESTNFLRKASDPLSVEGLTPDYAVQIGISENGSALPFSCDETRTFKVNLQIGGATQAGDSIYITLPAGFEYLANSYTPGQNAPSGGPQQYGNVLQLAIPPGLPANSALSFQFSLTTPPTPVCAEVLLQVQTRQQSEAFCPTINANCAVYVSTGEASYTLQPYDPPIFIYLSSVATNPEKGVTSYSITLANGGIQILEHAQILIVRDMNGDGQWTAADTIVETHYFNGSLDPSMKFTVSWIDSSQAVPDPCGLLAVLPGSEICKCDDVVVPFSTYYQIDAGSFICLGESVALGPQAQNGHVYQWSTTLGLPCTNCPNFVWTPPTTGHFLLFLKDYSDDDCLLEYSYHVVVSEAPVLTTPDKIICRGETALLETSPAATWHWEGPGIDDPADSTQLVQPAQTSTYFVTITNAAGCSTAADVMVTVLESDSINLGTLRTCEGTLVDVFGVMTDQPGFYCHQYPKSNGCDSTVCLLLEVTGNTAEEKIKCPEDSVLVFDNWVVDEGQYCQTFLSSLGCDSTHCVMVNNLAAPGLPIADTLYVISGDSVQLLGPPGFAHYHWSPAAGLSCVDCPNPLASPGDTVAVYSLTVTTDDGCSATWEVHLRFSPPCDVGELKIPNAITPDNDGTNDTFRPAPIENAPAVVRLRVFDRWGAKVYDETGPAAAWDGNIDGKPAPVDTYVWLLEVECSGEIKPLYGEVTVLR